MGPMGPAAVRSFVIRCRRWGSVATAEVHRELSMDEAFAVVAHPQLLVALGALLLLGVVALLESAAALQAWRWQHEAAQANPAHGGEAAAEPLGPEAYDWLYE